MHQKNPFGFFTQKIQMLHIWIFWVPRTHRRDCTGARTTAPFPKCPPAQNFGGWVPPGDDRTWSVGGNVGGATSRRRDHNVDRTHRLARSIVHDRSIWRKLPDRSTGRSQDRWVGVYPAHDHRTSPGSGTAMLIHTRTPITIHRWVSRPTDRPKFSGQGGLSFVRHPGNVFP